MSSKERAKQFTQLDFRPVLGCRSPLIQTLFACFAQPGVPPPSTELLIPLGDGDILSCLVSKPHSWTPSDKTVVLVHGLCGNHESTYMVRLSRKLYKSGFRAIRVNLRGCGSGSGLARLPYHGGVSTDLLTVLQTLHKRHQKSPLIVIGYSLGGNIAIKLAAELGETGKKLIKLIIAVCAPLDLAHAAKVLAQPQNLLYHQYYLYRLQKDAQRWLHKRSFSTLKEFDDLVTAPQWGFKDSADYYEKSSSYKLLPQVKLPCRLLYAQDDPIIDYRIFKAAKLPPQVKLFLTDNGGHMGFFGWAGEENRYFWLDRQLLHWVELT